MSIRISKRLGESQNTQHLADALADQLNQATSETEPGRV